MSRIGKNPIPIPSGVTVKINGRNVEVKGPRGVLSREIPEPISLVEEDGNILVKRPDDDAKNRSLHGLSRTLVANLVTGVTEGFSKVLEIVGVGYRAAVEGKILQLNLGYSQPVKMDIPEGISISVEKNTVMTVSGNNKEQVGDIAAKIRRYRKVEPYKGKGIRYQGEYVRRKIGKRNV